MDIERIKQKLLIKYPLFGKYLANANIKEDLRTKTACTDRKNIYYNPNFIDTLTELEQVFVFAHEISHIALDHIYRKEGKDRDTWNIASDAIINVNLEKDGLPILKGAVNIPRAIHYSTEELYKELYEQKENNQNKQGNSNENNDSSNKESSSEPSSFSESKIPSDFEMIPNNHTLWDKAIQERNDSQNQKTTESKDLSQKN
mgnify:FL=1